MNDLKHYFRNNKLTQETKIAIVYIIIMILVWVTVLVHLPNIIGSEAGMLFELLQKIIDLQHLVNVDGVDSIMLKIVIVSYYVTIKVISYKQMYEAIVRLVERKDLTSLITDLS